MTFEVSHRYWSQGIKGGKERVCNKVLITQDLDFSALLAAKRYEKRRVLSLHFDNAEPHFIADRIVEIVKEFEKELEEEIVHSVDGKIGEVSKFANHALGIMVGSVCLFHPTQT